MKKSLFSYSNIPEYLHSRLEKLDFTCTDLPYDHKENVFDIMGTAMYHVEGKKHTYKYSPVKIHHSFNSEEALVQFIEEQEAINKDMNDTHWIELGAFGVDAGLCWIGDPCYIHKDEDQKMPDDFGIDWSTFCNKLPFNDLPSYRQFNYDKGHRGLGVCLSTGYGDGFYPVYGRIHDGRITAVVIDFLCDDAEEFVFQRREDE